MKRSFIFLLVAAALGGVSLAHAGRVTITIRAIDATTIGKKIGTVHAEDSTDGLVLTPHLGSLLPGAHGFHVHENPSCAPAKKDGKMVAGLAAGGHWDPDKTGKHEGPYGHGHRGDLPVLEVTEGGIATKVIVAPRLKVADLKGHSLVIHAGGDNYSDQPQPLGGGGARIACGVIK